MAVQGFRKEVPEFDFRQIKKAVEADDVFRLTELMNETQLNW